VAVGAVVNLTATSVTAAAAAVAAPNLALVTPATAVVAASPVTFFTVAALSTFSANGSGATKRLSFHSVCAALVVAVVLVCVGGLGGVGRGLGFEDSGLGLGGVGRGRGLGGVGRGLGGVGGLGVGGLGGGSICSSWSRGWE